MITTVYGKKVLIRELAKAEEKENTYILPEDMEETPSLLIGVVTHIGDVEHTKVKDVVVYDQYDHKVLIIEGNKYICSLEKDLICKIEENNE